MAKKIRFIWQKILTFILSLFGVTPLSSCGGVVLMYGMVDMYGMPDPIDTPAMYGPGPEIETIYGVVRRGTSEEKGKVEITSADDESTADGIKGIQVIIGTKEKGTIDSCITTETGEFYLNADKYLNEEI